MLATTIHLTVLDSSKTVDGLILIESKGLTDLRHVAGFLAQQHLALRIEEGQVALGILFHREHTAREGVTLLGDSDLLGLGDDDKTLRGLAFHHVDDRGGDELDGQLLRLLRGEDTLDAGGIEVVEVAPFIIRCLFGGYGQRGLLPIEQQFDEDILSIVATIEHQLDVGGHTGLPVLIDILHLIGILWVEVGTIDTHQDSERADTGVVTKTEVGNTVARAIDDSLSLAEEVLQDGNHVVTGTEYPGIRAEVGGLPLAGNLLVGDDTLHHALMTDAGQGGIEVGEHIAETVYICESLRRGEHALDDGLRQRRGSLELGTILLVAGCALGELATQGILTVCRHHPVEGVARRLLTDLDLRIALHQFLTEGRHTQYTAP